MQTAQHRRPHATSLAEADYLAVYRLLYSTMLDEEAYHGAISLGATLPAMGIGTVVAAGSKAKLKVGGRDACVYTSTDTNCCRHFGSRGRGLTALSLHRRRDIFLAAPPRFHSRARRAGAMSSSGGPAVVPPVLASHPQPIRAVPLVCECTAHVCAPCAHGCAPNQS